MNPKYENIFDLNNMFTHNYLKLVDKTDPITGKILISKKGKPLKENVCKTIVTYPKDSIIFTLK
jgi:hypothetical protein